LLALRRENKEVLWSSMVKDTMKRKKPSFNEAYHGYRTFSELLEDAQKEGLLELDTDKRSRTYVVTRFGDEMSTPAAPAVKPKTSRRRRSSTRRRSAAPAKGAEAKAGGPEAAADPDPASENNRAASNSDPPDIAEEPRRSGEAEPEIGNDIPF
jgi:hypothetical protein